jgi:hypothetical protein
MVDAFFPRETTVCGVRIRGSARTRPSALDAAATRIERLLGRAPGVVRNLAAAGAELQVFAESESVTDLPMYRHMRGVPFDGARTMDERGRGYGGLHACIGEESLLGLPSARHADHRDICSHELGHTVLDYGVDPAFRARWRAFHAETASRWAPAYASTNADERFAELTMWFAGSHGDWPPGLTQAGSAALRRFDPDAWALLESVYSGRYAPAPFAWIDLGPTDARRSASGTATSIAVLNRTGVALERRWVDYEGKERTYGPVPPGALIDQSTYVTHVWRVYAGERRLGTWVAIDRPGRVVIEPAHLGGQA